MEKVQRLGHSGCSSYWGSRWTVRNRWRERCGTIVMVLLRILGGTFTAWIFWLRLVIPWVGRGNLTCPFWVSGYVALDFLPFAV
jgi:hypothetical protein